MGFEQIEDLNAALGLIDELQRRVDALKEARPDAYDRLMEGWAVESTYNSNNIEGSTLTLGDTALLYDGVKVDAPEEDIRQAEGGFAALRFLSREVSLGSELTEDLVKRAHELVFAEARDSSTRGGRTAAPRPRSPAPSSSRPPRATCPSAWGSSCRAARGAAGIPRWSPRCSTSSSRASTRSSTRTEGPGAS